MTVSLSAAEEFSNFAYHCQFARLNDSLTNYLRSLACDRQIAFSGCLSIQQISECPSLQLKTILYLTQSMRRQVGFNMCVISVIPTPPARILILVEITTDNISEKRNYTSSRVSHCDGNCTALYHRCAI